MLVVGLLTNHLCLAYCQVFLVDPTMPISDEPPAASQQIKGAAIAWDDGGPPAGNLVKVRVRGEVLGHLLGRGNTWAVYSGDLVIPTRLIPAKLPGPIQTEDLDFEIVESPDSPSLKVEIDRGEEPSPLNRLAISFATSSYLGVVEVMCSTNQMDYRQAGNPKLVFQKISGGRILRLGELQVEVGAKRYLRLSMPIPASGGIQGIQGWFDPQTKLAAYKVQATLGPMRQGTQTSESVWPIFMKPDNLPIAKIKVIADTVGTVRQMHIAILDGASLGPRVGKGITWAGQLEKGQHKLANKWITLTGEPQSGPWAIVVDDDAAKPLQLSGVEVYLLEHWLVFEMPWGLGDEPQLWQVNGTVEESIALKPPQANLEDAAIVGTIIEWNLAKQPTLEPSLSRNWINRPLDYAKRGGWQVRVYAYLALALALLIIGGTMLRRELRNQHPG